MTKELRDKNIKWLVSKGYGNWIKGCSDSEIVMYCRMELHRIFH